MNRVFVMKVVRDSLALVAYLAANASSAIAQPTTTTTTYVYNSDGALTQVMTQTDNQAPEVQYCTWDNFLPDTSNPATGTIRPGIGHIIGYGPAPGAAASSSRFEYDLQDRLRQFSQGQRVVDYEYHPSWLLSSSQLESGDAFRFYYHPGHNPAISNIEQSAAGTVSGRMGPLRVLSDGASQVLIGPRKDVAGVYDPAQEAYTPYHYDPFGKDETEAAEETDYDVEANPYRYAGEYRDAIWGGYYLRDRWYDSELHTFLSRDPDRNLNRYAYTSGNPVNRVDPSGRKYKVYKKKMRGLSKFLHKTIGCKNCAPGRIFLGPLLSPLSLIADPAGFYHSQFSQNKGFGFEVMLGTTALEVLADFEFAMPGDNYLLSYGLRLVADSVSGGANSVAAATSHNFSRFSKRTFFQGLEYTAGGVGYARLLVGRGYRPFNRTFEDMERELPTLAPNEARVYRVKTPLSGRLGKIGVRTSGPIGDLLNLSYHHELLVAFTQDKVYISEVGDTGLFAGGMRTHGAGQNYMDSLNDQGARFRFLGRSTEQELKRAFKTNPTGIKADAPMTDFPRDQTRVAHVANLVRDRRNSPRLPYSVWRRNCQMHVSGMVGQINFIDP